MISQIRGLIRFSMGLLVGLALMTSCGGDQASEVEVGEVRLPLQTTSVEGVDFWLRGCFEITGPSYPTAEVVCTDDYADEATEINLSVKSGAYGILLQDGFGFALGASEPTTWLPIPFPEPFPLMSPNPQTVQVVTDQVTVVSLQFLSPDGTITFNFGETPCRT